MRRKNSALSVDVAVVGGGLGGLAMAAALGTAGINTLCLDRETPAAQLSPKFDGRTTAVSFASQQILSSAGVWQHIGRHAEPIRSIRVTDQNAPLHLHFPTGAVTDGPFGYIVDNRELRQALFARLRQLESVTHLAPAELKTLKADDEKAALQLSDGRTLHAKLVIGADGKDSPCRKAAGINVRTRPYGQSAIVCTIKTQHPHQGVALENFQPGGPFAVLPMTGQRCSIVWSERETLAKHYLELSDSEFEAELEQRMESWLGKVKLVSPRFLYPLTILHAARYTAPRLALISEAAHRMHPIAGQGLNIGMRDVAWLAELVADALRAGEDIGSPALLRAYERGRKADTLAMLAGTDVLTHLFSNNLPGIRLARRLGLAGVERTTHLKGFFMRYAMGLVGPQTRMGQGLPL
jgi:2-octaprenyl-6-methoxyphenol hydroxylase